MTTYAIYQGTATDQAGNVLASPTIEVRNESDNSLASLKADRTGAANKTNSFTGNADGTFEFYVTGGAYKITITQGSVTRTLRYVAIGTASEHDFSAGTNDLYYDLKLDFGAVGDQVTDDTAAIQNALNTVPANATLFVPEGFYSVKGSGTSALTRQLPINIVGAGYLSTGFFFEASVPNTRDMLTINNDIAGTMQGIHIHDIALLTFGLGRDVLVIDAGVNSPGEVIYQVHVHDCYIYQTSTAGDAIHLKGNVAYSTIERCNLSTILLEQAGDGITIRENVIGNTSRNTIEASFTAGATGLRIMNNVITGLAHFVRITNGASTVIAFNEFETNFNQTNTIAAGGGGLVDIGSTNSPFEVILGPMLIGNEYSVLPGTNNPIPIRIRSGVEGCQIKEARILNQTGAHIVVDSGAIGTSIDRDTLAYTNNVQAWLFVTNNGTRTGQRSSEAMISANQNLTGQNINTAQPWLHDGGSPPVTQSITLRASTIYEFDGWLMLSKTAGTTSRTIGVSFGGTATLFSIAYWVEAVGVDGTVFAGASNPVSSYVETAANQTVFGIASISANQLVSIRIRGRMITNAAGTFIPQFTYSAAPGGAPLMRQHSFFRVRDVGL